MTDGSTEPNATRQRAPEGDLATFESYPFTADGVTHTVYRKGTGPVVVVITEMPGISPMVLGFADRVVTLGCTAVLPDLFGEAGKDPMQGNPLSVAGYGLKSMGGACISREFSVMAAGKSSPVVSWLRALAARGARTRGWTRRGRGGHVLHGRVRAGDGGRRPRARAGDVPAVVAVPDRRGAQGQRRHERHGPRRS